MSVSNVCGGVKNCLCDKDHFEVHLRCWNKILEAKKAIVFLNPPSERSQIISLHTCETLRDYLWFQAWPSWGKLLSKIPDYPLIWDVEYGGRSSGIVAGLQIWPHLKNWNFSWRTQKLQIWAHLEFPTPSPTPKIGTSDDELRNFRSDQPWISPLPPGPPPPPELDFLMEQLDNIGLVCGDLLFIPEFSWCTKLGDKNRNHQFLEGYHEQQVISWK